MVPGMFHCSGGPGANSFDTLTALDNWVEQGTPPDQIVATHYNNNVPADGVAFTRPLCPYPQVAKYSGGGATTQCRQFCLRRCKRQQPPLTILRAANHDGSLWPGG